MGSKIEYWEWEVIWGEMGRKKGQFKKINNFLKKVFIEESDCQSVNFIFSSEEAQCL